jgi:transposase-like protein
MDCPKCKRSHHVKDGIVRGKQRYKCKGCHYRYTVERKSDVKTPETRRLALEMYLEGLGFRSIGRILKISYGTVYLWVKEWSTNVSFPRRKTPMEIVELEKMLTYIESKKTSTPHYGLMLIDLKDNISLLSVK